MLGTQALQLEARANPTAQAEHFGFAEPLVRRGRIACSDLTRSEQVRDGIRLGADTTVMWNSLSVAHLVECSFALAMRDLRRKSKPFPISALALALAAFSGCVVATVEAPPEQPASAPYIDLLACDPSAANPNLVPTPFGGAGDVFIEAKRIVIGMGSPLTGVSNPNFPARGDYELHVIATRTGGSDFFCGLTFPVMESHLTLVLGGWGGALCGLSTLDGLDASQNETKSFRKFERNRPYDLKIEVRRERVVALLDGEPLLDVALTGRTAALRTEMLPCRPLGIATYNTSAVISRFEWRTLPQSEIR